MSSQPSPKAAPVREWMPRLWQGCSLPAWLRLLVRNHCAVDPPYWYIASVITCVSTFHVGLRLLQDAWFGDRVKKTPIPRAPIFIVGHWRTGTTLLHELLILDKRHTFPNTYQCLAPHHFLLTEKVLPRLFWWLMPSRRPMDNMEAGWDKPQEDEFALCMLGQPSPYLTIGFPNHPPQDQDAFDLERLPKYAVARWKEAFLLFLRQLTYKDPRRLVLKSPTHSCRIPTLLELFPDARFVHIVRDPYVVFPSTVNLWKSLYTTHGMQTPRFEGLEEHVFSTFSHLYERLEMGKKLIRPGRYHELRYEDLIRDPLGEMGLLYDRLELGEFHEVRPRLEKYLEAHAGYKTNRYNSSSPELAAKITRRWEKVIHQFGYERSP
jgi:omega-hydroxy-beta-dihydromenaquinone-9 sulfotransferase